MAVPAGVRGDKCAPCKAFEASAGQESPAELLGQWVRNERGTMTYRPWDEAESASMRSPRPA